MVVTDEQSDHVLDLDRWARLAAHALASRGVTRGELSLTFVDEEAITGLNADHMGEDGPTDVLSFPLDADALDAEPPTPGSLASQLPTLLGDVVICPAVAARNAADHAAGAAEPHPGHPTHDGSLDAELALLVVHGVLHVLGHDHAEPDETAAMQAAEREILAAVAAGEVAS
ncbi:rRNA maturation RNase YbeY [Actinomarinicola tropica]|uniref:Endoribonuclease YbeY n=1 Tax=Actinomarinicola tropica TaxID=2789776 RepID=A0A5Q2RR98_9ACTN|nr:rRNA maturation RNase YbeY [Actinomarinicola tropica]